MAFFLQNKYNPNVCQIYDMLEQTQTLFGVYNSMNPGLHSFESLVKNHLILDSVTFNIILREVVGS